MPALKFPGFSEPCPKPGSGHTPATTMETSNSPNPRPGSTTPNAATGASNDKLFIVLAHLSPFLGVGIILPLIIWLVKKSEADNVAYHAKEALNFQITVLLAAIVCWLLIFLLIGIVLLPLLILGALILAIVAAVKSANGERYRYPFILRLIG